MAPYVTHNERPVSLYDLFQGGEITWEQLCQARDRELVARKGGDADNTPPLPNIPGLSKRSLYAQCVLAQATKRLAAMMPQREYTTAKSPLHCHDPVCKATISANCVFRHRAAYCLRCGETSCARCGRKEHPACAYPV